MSFTGQYAGDIFFFKNINLLGIWAKNLFILVYSTCYTLVSILLYRIRIPRICQYLKPGRHDSAKNCHRSREAFFSIFISLPFVPKKRQEKNLQRTRFYIEHKSKSSLILVSLQDFLSLLKWILPRALKAFSSNVILLLS